MTRPMIWPLLCVSQPKVVYVCTHVVYFYACLPKESKVGRELGGIKIRQSHLSCMKWSETASLSTLSTSTVECIHSPQCCFMSSNQFLFFLSILTSSTAGGQHHCCTWFSQHFGGFFLETQHFHHPSLFFLLKDSADDTAPEVAMAEVEMK